MVYSPWETQADRERELRIYEYHNSVLLKDSAAYTQGYITFERLLALNKNELEESAKRQAARVRAWELEERNMGIGDTKMVPRLGFWDTFADHGEEVHFDPPADAGLDLTRRED